MEPQNGTGQEHPVVVERLEALKDGLGKLVDRIISKPTGEPSRFKTLSDKATQTIKAHPIAAAAFALGLGYLLVRIVRR